MVAIQKVGTSPLVIPRPPEPQMPDEDPSAYIPSGMSEGDRRELREAGIEWTSTLGGNLGRLGARWTGRGQAAQNMRHFRTGNGADRTLDADFVDAMGNQSVELDTFQNTRLIQFRSLIRDDLAGSPRNTAGQYLILNNDGGRNNGTNWYGLYANDGSALYFTVGGFFVSYGAVGIRGASGVSISYKMYVWDRYNWDTNKATRIPGNQLSYLLNDGEMDDIAGLQAPGANSADYFRREVDKAGNTTYIVNDALIGALVESGDAANFDIVGAGNVQTVRFALDSDAPHSSGPTTTPAQGGRN